MYAAALKTTVVSMDATVILPLTGKLSKLSLRIVKCRRMQRVLNSYIGHPSFSLFGITYIGHWNLPVSGLISHATKNIDNISVNTTRGVDMKLVIKLSSRVHFLPWPQAFNSLLYISRKSKKEGTTCIIFDSLCPRRRLANSDVSCCELTRPLRGATECERLSNRYRCAFFRSL